MAVGGAVAALVDAHAFTLAETGAGGAGDTGHPVVLVLTRDPVPRAGGWRGRRTIAPGDQLQVLGAVRAFDLPRIEAEVGTDLRDAAFGAWAARPAIVATSLARLVSPGTTDARARTPAPPQREWVVKVPGTKPTSNCLTPRHIIGDTGVQSAWQENRLPWPIGATRTTRPAPLR